MDKLAKLLIEKKCGIVAHFYMDPEVQGVLMRCKAKHPECASRIFISDSLVMAYYQLYYANGEGRKVRKRLRFRCRFHVRKRASYYR